MTIAIQHRAAFILLVLLICICSLPAPAGEQKITKKDVPSAVLKSFAKTYPNAKVNAYAKEKENGKTYYELETIDGKTKRDLLYSADGTAVEIEEAITMQDLPEPVANAFAKESPKNRAIKIEKVTKGDTVTFDFTMGKGKTELVIDPAGTVVKHSRAVKGKAEKEENEKGAG